MSSEIERLHAAVSEAIAADPDLDATARLLKAGRLKIAKKLIEEAAEVSLAAMQGRRKEVVRETADLFYNLMVLFVSMGLRPEEVWREMAEREAQLGLAAKLPKTRSRAARTAPGTP